MLLIVFFTMPMGVSLGSKFTSTSNILYMVKGLYDSSVLML